MSVVSRVARTLLSACARSGNPSYCNQPVIDQKATLVV
jgi:hypothetical protein